MNLGPIFRSILRNTRRFTWIVVEVGVTLAVITNCVTLIFEARREMARPSGFDDDHLLSVETEPWGEEFKGEEYEDNLLKQDLAALRAMPGVRSVSSTWFLPWGGRFGWQSYSWVTGRNKDFEKHRTQLGAGDEHLVETLGAELSEGRSFTPEEVARGRVRWRAYARAASERDENGLLKKRIFQEVLITLAYAERVFGSGPYLGKVLQDPNGNQHLIVGVIKNFHSPCSLPLSDYAVFGPNTESTAFLVRLQPDTSAEIQSRIEPLLLSQNNSRAVTVRRVVDVRAKHFGAQHFTAALMAGMALLLLTVTALGIVGMTSFSVTERARQIGTRRALGATRWDTIRDILIENLLLIGFGLTLGLVLAYALNLVLMHRTNTPRLPPDLVLATATVLWAVGLLAALVPALRAARVSPAVATRNI